ncbi:hypothetical protein AVDCRST_MAG81-1681 [uncultured Synechococcales cyanobacterium]|uniref:Uncharacterized protein n=1 Tax=uncultured Synechococcales cyanobacterium TaxID=1936017 RepID=A0A6J4V736_9CYAN|nr:hypothetical protein AVDCRST_MAG81-1681 [uncultured Synechococcales cyanobacterium]
MKLELIRELSRRQNSLEFLISLANGLVISIREYEDVLGVSWIWFKDFELAQSSLGRINSWEFTFQKLPEVPILNNLKFGEVLLP